MRPSPKFIIPTAAVAALLLSACGATSHSSAGAPSRAASAPLSRASSGPLVKTRSVTSLAGPVLVDAGGLTLYRLSGERAGNFICTTSGCLQAWHPLTVRGAGKPTGSVPSLSVVRRPDGSEQVTYKGLPLYTFAQDTAPGQVNGQGIKDVGTWAAVTAGAAKGSSAQAAPSAPAPSSSGGGYGY